MGTTVEASFSVAAPSGSHWSWEEVKGERGTKSFGEVPLLVWDSIESVRATFGDEGIADILDGTSLRVSYQSIARRGMAQNKSHEDIAKAQIAFRPGKRAVGQSTPVSRAASAARRAAEKVSGDTLAALLEKVASGAFSDEDLKALAGN